MIPESQIRSHGRWPVREICTGHVIRFRSSNYGNEVIMKVDRLHDCGQMVVVSGSVIAGGYANDVALKKDEKIELVTVYDDQGNRNK